MFMKLSYEFMLIESCWPVKQININVGMDIAV